MAARKGVRRRGRPGDGWWTATPGPEPYSGELRATEDARAQPALEAGPAVPAPSPTLLGIRLTRNTTMAGAVAGLGIAAVAVALVTLTGGSGTDSAGTSGAAGQAQRQATLPTGPPSSTTTLPGTTTTVLAGPGPSLGQLNHAIEFTGLILCAGNQGQSSLESFSVNRDGCIESSDIVRVWQDVTVSAHQHSLQRAESRRSGPVWADDTFVVLATNPPVDLDTALVGLDFHMVSNCCIPTGRGPATTVRKSPSTSVA